MQAWIRTVIVALALVWPGQAFGQEIHNDDWFIHTIKPHFDQMFDQCGCPIYGFKDIMTWEDKDTPGILYWNVTVIISQKHQNVWQPIGRIFTYKFGLDKRMHLFAVGDAFVWNPM